MGGQMSELYTSKALLALAFLASRDYLGGIRVSNFRDDADVGWIKATITTKYQSRGSRSNNLPVSEYKVSPLGHIYDFKGGEPVWEFVSKAESVRLTSVEFVTPGEVLEVGGRFKKHEQAIGKPRHSGPPYNDVGIPL